MTRKHPNPLIHELHLWIEKDLWTAYRTLCTAKNTTAARDIRKLIKWRVDKTMQNVLNQSQDIKAPPVPMVKGAMPK